MSKEVKVKFNGNKAPYAEMEDVVKSELARIRNEERDNMKMRTIKTPPMKGSISIKDAEAAARRLKKPLPYRTPYLMPLYIGAQKARMVGYKCSECGGLGLLREPVDHLAKCTVLKDSVGTDG